MVIASGTDGSFRYRRTPPLPPANDLELPATGATGAVAVLIVFDVIRATRHHACRGVRVGDSLTQRSSGQEQVRFELCIRCSADEGDEFTVHGGGPGPHTNVTDHNVRANDFGWFDRTAATTGRERATIWAVDALGARSAEAPFDFETSTRTAR